MQQTIIQSLLSGAGFAAWQISTFPQFGLTGTAIAASVGLMVSALRLLKSKVVLTVLALALAITVEPVREVLVDFYQNIISY